MSTPYTPQHPNEGLIAHRLDTGAAVGEFSGGPGKFAKLERAINKAKYGVMYVGEYLAKLNSQT